MKRFEDEDFDALIDTEVEKVLAEETKDEECDKEETNEMPIGTGSPAPYIDLDCTGYNQQPIKPIPRIFTMEHRDPDKMPETVRERMRKIDAYVISSLDRARLKFIAKGIACKSIKDMDIPDLDVLEKSQMINPLNLSSILNPLSGTRIYNHRQINPVFYRNGRFDENGYIRIYPLINMEMRWKRYVGKHGMKDKSKQLKDCRKNDRLDKDEKIMGDAMTLYATSIDRLLSSDQQLKVSQVAIFVGDRYDTHIPSPINMNRNAYLVVVFSAD